MSQSQEQAQANMGRLWHARAKACKHMWIVHQQRSCSIETFSYQLLRLKVVCRVGVHVVEGGHVVQACAWMRRSAGEVR